MRKFSRSRPPTNSLNDRILTWKKEDIPVELRTAFRRQKPPSITVWAGATSDGKRAPLIFVEEGVKVDQAVFYTFFPR
ncbi:Putative DD37D maT transposase, partial [Caligus rogercresseyi]